MVNGKLEKILLRARGDGERYALDKLHIKNGIACATDGAGMMYSAVPGEPDRYDEHATPEFWTVIERYGKRCQKTFEYTIVELFAKLERAPTRFWATKTENVGPARKNEERLLKADLIVAASLEGVSLDLMRLRQYLVGPRTRADRIIKVSVAGAKSPAHFAWREDGFDVECYLMPRDD